MKFWSRLTANYKRLKYYESISDLPVRIWFAIFKSGNYMLLLKESATKTTKNFIKLSKVWEDLFNEYINEFGLSESYMDDLESSVNLAILKADLIITGQRYLKTMIKIEEQRIKMESLELKEPEGLEKILAKMSKYYGFKLSSRDLTTKEYYSYLFSIK